VASSDGGFDEAVGRGRTSVGTGTGGTVSDGRVGTTTPCDGDGFTAGALALGDRAGGTVIEADGDGDGAVQSTTAVTGRDGAAEAAGAAPMPPAPVVVPGTVWAAGSPAGAASCQPMVTAKGEPSRTMTINTDLGESRTYEHRSAGRKSYGVFRNSEMR
jgi:hypothetical protein